MIFHKNFFQCVTAPIPLFQTPQKIGLLIFWNCQFCIGYLPKIDTDSAIKDLFTVLINA